MASYNALYQYLVKDFYNNKMRVCYRRCVVIGESLKSYRIRLLEPCRDRFCGDELWVRKRAVVLRSYLDNDTGVCSLYSLKPADASCKACLQKCYRRSEFSEINNKQNN